MQSGKLRTFLSVAFQVICVCLLAVSSLVFFLSLFSPGRYDGIYALNIELWRMFDKVIPVIN